ncbi:MAG: hypothetical protein AAGF12_25020 [Myxococcota bacterium]
MRWRLGVGLILLGCGAGEAPVERARAVEDVPPETLLLQFGANHTSTLREPERSLEELEDSRETAAGVERRQILRDLALAHLFEAEYLDEEEDERSLRRHRRKATQFAEAAGGRGADAYLAAEMDFVRLWCTWRGGRGPVDTRAERFIDRYPNSGDLLLLAWMIRGEVAFEEENFEGAANHFRFALGQLGHPLYAYALYRTAQSWEALGRGDDAREALEEVLPLACPEDATEETVTVASMAAGALDAPLVRYEGRTVPEECVPATEP